MPTIPLPNEVQYLIITFLDSDDYGTKFILYKYLFVNRFWCRCIIPILWRRPRIDARVIRTYLSCLNYDELKTLIPFRINLPANKPSPLFEYGMFLEVIKLSDINRSIKSWLSKEGYKIESGTWYKRIESWDHLMNSVKTVIWRMLMRRCRRITSIDLKLEHGEGDIPDIYSRKAIYNLKDFNFNILSGEFKEKVYKNSIELLRRLPLLSTRLKHILWNSPLYSDLLVNLIKTQNGLETFNISQMSLRSNLTILSSLRDTQSTTLTSFFASHVHFNKTSIQIIGGLHNLKTLSLSYCAGLEPKHCEIISRASFRLNKLILRHNSWFFKVDLAIFEKAGQYLQSITLYDNFSSEIIRKAHKHCPNIKKMIIYIESSMHIPSFGTWISGLQNLHTLVIIDAISCSRIPELAEKLPKSLQHFKYHGNLVSIDEFSKFFELCTVPLDSISIYPISFNYVFDQYISVICEFAIRVKSLKRLFLSRRAIPKQWQPQELELKKELEKQGVDMRILFTFYED
ncbi:13723_t:CDS:1 [Dentiscutata heterogama]|uniref:13723_t:CDS:1 n=1 Tax=Dentiscutata heterogama TaxID=1316150 RepID=A0ACA9MCA1_9GLOM|nr:13723_t:CDS:1 [Dentiscutata heterogama]